MLSLLRRSMKKIIPDIFAIEKKAPKKSPVQKTNKKMKPDLAALRLAAPDVFVEDYARHACQNKPGIQRRPVIIDPDDVVRVVLNENHERVVVDPEDYDQIADDPRLGPLYQERNTGRQIFKMDLNNGDPLFLACPSDRLPYPAVRPHELRNKALYKCLPCCFTANNIDYPDSLHYACINGTTKKERRKKKIVPC